jgi:hypothetical protein
VNFEYYATFSGTDAAGTAVQSSTVTKVNRGTCNGIGLGFVHIFLFIGVIISGVLLVLVSILCVGQLCELAKTQYHRLRNLIDNDNDNNNDNGDIGMV